MREIKFRAWDIKAKRHYEWEFLAVASNNGRFSEWCISGDGMTVRVDSENYILEQYTGLKDKNGVEIYEGDRVEAQYNYLGVVTVSFVDGKYNISEYSIEKCEVIGNIHQNPELLK